MLSAAEGCREPSGKYQGIVKEFHIVWRVVTPSVALGANDFHCVARPDFDTDSNTSRQSFSSAFVDLWGFMIILQSRCFVELLFLRSGSFTLYFHEFMELNLNEINSFIDLLHVTSNFLTLTS